MWQLSVHWKDGPDVSVDVDIKHLIYTTNLITILFYVDTKWIQTLDCKDNKDSNAKSYLYFLCQTPDPDTTWNKMKESQLRSETELW